MRIRFRRPFHVPWMLIYDKRFTSFCFVKISTTTIVGIEILLSRWVGGSPAWWTIPLFKWLPLGRRFHGIHDAQEELGRLEDKHQECGDRAAEARRGSDA